MKEKTYKTKNLDYIIESDYSWESVTNKSYKSHSYGTHEKRVALGEYISMMLSPEYRQHERHVFMAAKRELENIEKTVTKTGTCPGTGKQITHTASVNEPHYMSRLSESYWSM